MGIDPGTKPSQRIDLSPQQLRLVQDLLAAHLSGVEVWAYGSRVRGTARRYSDLDMVAFTEPVHSAQLNILQEAFEESDLPFRVDLFSWPETPASFHPQIKANYVVLQEGDPRPE